MKIKNKQNRYLFPDTSFSLQPTTSVFSLRQFVKKNISSKFKPKGDWMFKRKTHPITKIRVESINSEEELEHDYRFLIISIIYLFGTPFCCLAFSQSTRSNLHFFSAQLVRPLHPSLLSEISRFIFHRIYVIYKYNCAPIWICYVSKQF